MRRGLIALAAGAALVSTSTPAAAAPALSWRIVQTRCVAGVVHLDVAVTGAVVGQSYAIYGTSGLLASNETVTAKAASFTATFTPNEAYGANDAGHFSVTGDLEAPSIGQRSQVRTISASCSAVSRPPATVPTTLSTSLGFDANALAPQPRRASSHTGRDAVIAVVVAIVVLGAGWLVWRRMRRG